MDKKEIPILFNGEMVQAILNGEKCMTRRIIKPQPELRVKQAGPLKLFKKPIDLKQCPYGGKGDLLWVRETWTSLKVGEKIYYGYKSLEKYPSRVKYKPSIHMPKVAARIWLEVEGVKVERLQDISKEDILAEGVRVRTHEGMPVFNLCDKITALDFLPKKCLTRTPELTMDELLRANFAALWSNIHGIESWYENPWVYAILFKEVSREGRPTSTQTTTKRELISL